MKTDHTTNTAGAVLGAPSAGKPKIDRVDLVNTLTSLRNDPQLPPDHIPSIDKCLADDARLIRSVSEAELERLVTSLQPIINKIKAKEAPLCDVKPSADTHTLADSFDTSANPETQAERTLNYGAGKSARGQIELRIDLAKIRAAIDDPRHVSKDDALWTIPSGVASRASDAKKQPVKSALLMIDLDDMEGRTLQDARTALYAVAGMPVQHDIYTTYSATEADQRCRIVIPLSKVIESEDAYQGALQWLIDGMAAQGVKVDPLLDIKRLLYLPNHADGTFYDKLSAAVVN